MQTAADDAESARNAGGAAADVRLAGNMVKVQPLPVGGVHNALRAQHRAVFRLVVQRGEDGLQLRLRELPRRLHTPAREHLVRVVVVVVMVVLVVVVMVMAAAAAVLIVLIVIIIVIVVVIMVMVVMMLVLVLVVVVIVVMVVMTAAAVVVIIVVIFFVRMLGGELRELAREGVRVLHGAQDLSAGELAPRRRDDDGFAVQPAQQLDRGGELFLAALVRAA